MCDLHQWLHLLRCLGPLPGLHCRPRPGQEEALWPRLQDGEGLRAACWAPSAAPAPCVPPARPQGVAAAQLGRIFWGQQQLNHQLPIPPHPHILQPPQPNPTHHLPCPQCASNRCDNCDGNVKKCKKVGPACVCSSNAGCTLPHRPQRSTGHPSHTPGSVVWAMALLVVPVGSARTRCVPSATGLEHASSACLAWRPCAARASRWVEHCSE